MSTYTYNCQDLLIEGAVQQLSEKDRQGVKVFSSTDLYNLFGVDNSRSLRRIIRSLMSQGMLQRVARGVYFNRGTCSNQGYLIEEIAQVLRKGHFNYVSLESILSEFGVISQIMVSRITVMTTGRSGTFKTPYGIIEFTHTKRSLECLRERTIEMDRRPLRIATKMAGAADLRRIGRNVNMMDLDELNCVGI